jgi:hypothetical protein
MEGVDGQSVMVAPDEQLIQRVYLTAAPQSAPAEGATTEVRIWVEVEGEVDGQPSRDYRDTVFNGRGL